MKSADKYERLRKILLVFYLLITNCSLLIAQNTEASRLATIRYGTDTEIASLVQALRSENADYLDDELAVLVETTKNTTILNGVFAFFGDREKSGLEDRAVRIIEERDYEAASTVLAAIDYLGRVKAAQAVPVLIEVLDTDERRFMNNAFRALGRAASADSELAEEAADFLIDFYTNRNPGSDNARDVITALGATGSASTVSLLAEIAADDNERFPLRVAALEALSKVGDDSGLRAILDCVGADDPNVRSAAVAALGPFSGEEVDKAILDAFRDSFYRTRIGAAQASRERRLAAAIPYLQYRAERDDVPAVREEAIRALGAIAAEDADAVGVLDAFFIERKNADRVRLVSAEMLMGVDAQNYFGKVVAEFEEARSRNHTALVNGFSKIIGEAVLDGNKSELENIARRFMREGSVVEKMYGLDMAANNNLISLEEEIKNLENERNESISRRATRTADRLGFGNEELEISDHD